jgi:hypothetical protein
MKARISSRSIDPLDALCRRRILDEGTSAAPPFCYAGADRSNEEGRQVVWYTSVDLQLSEQIGGVRSQISGRHLQG